MSTSPPVRLQSPSHRGKRQQQELLTELRRKQGKDSRHVYEGKDGAIEDIITGKPDDIISDITARVFGLNSNWLSVFTFSSEDRPLYCSVGKTQLTLLLWSNPLRWALLMKGGGTGSTENERNGDWQTDRQRYFSWIKSFSGGHTYMWLNRIISTFSDHVTLCIIFKKDILQKLT